MEPESKYPRRGRTNSEKVLVESESDSLPLEAIKSPVQHRRQELLEIKNAPKKLDEVFGLIRSESVDEFRTDIKIRGMGNVKLKPQSIRKSTFDHNRLEVQIEQKKAAQRQIAMPEKPATYKKPKLKPKIEIVDTTEPTKLEEPASPKPSVEVSVGSKDLELFKEILPEPPLEHIPELQVEELTDVVIDTTEEEVTRKDYDFY